MDANTAIWGCQVKYRLGLDIGTASVGLVALELDGEGRPVKPVHHSVRIFDEPLLPPKSGGVGKTKKSGRRVHRQQRKLHMRRARRLQRIAQLAPLMGLDPKTIPADKGQRVHKLRAQAATVEIPLEDLLLVFLKMVKRRGYYGGFKVKKSGDTGMVEIGIGKLKAEMKKAGCGTLGEYLLHRIQNGQHLRLKEEGLFAHRDMVEEEFNRIWDVQEGRHEKLRDEDLRKDFHKVIVLQRPLKSPAHMVGNCSLEPMLPRAPMAQPIMQAFRIEKQLADLRWGASSRAEPLTAEQRNVIREQLQAKPEVELPALYKVLEKSGCPGPQGRELNYERGDRQVMTGDRTAAAMKWLGLLQDWNALDAGHQISVINLLADMGSPDAFDNPQWAENLVGAKVGANKTQRNIKPEVKHFIDQMVTTGKFGRLSEMKFDGGRASYSIKALSKLVPIMREKGLDEHDAIAAAYPDNEPGTKLEKEKELPPHPSTGNTVIDVALGQVRREVNAAIKKLGTPPSQIIVELSRDMKVGLTKRGKINDKMRANEKRRREAAGTIEEHTRKAATESQIRRYLLWQEQGEKYCPYCERHINKLSDALNGNETEYEHILPRSLTRIGKKRDFLVLAHKSCNQEKGKRTPRQAWGHDEERWNIIERRAEQFEKGRKITIAGKERTLFKRPGKARQLLMQDFENEALSDKIIDNFTDRQFQETAWIAKACGKWLRSVCADVSFSRGLLTAHLRRNWKLDTVIPEVRFEEDLPVFDEDYRSNTKESSQQGCAVSKDDFKKYRSYWEGHHGDGIPRTHRRLNKRVDHRHHLVDALVIALTTRRMYQRMAKHYKQVTDSGKNSLRLYAEPGIKGICALALDMVRECQPSHRPDRWPGGGFFKDNPGAIVEENGERFYARRKKLTDLGKTDMDKILPESVREIVGNAYKSRIQKGADHESALKEPIFHPHWKTPIRRVLVRRNKAEDDVLIEHGDSQRIQGKAADSKSSLHKYLEPDGYAYLEYIPGDLTTEPRLVRLHEAKSTSSQTVRLYKKDTVRDSQDERRYVIHQIMAEGPALFLSPVTESIADIGKVRGNRKRKIFGKQIAKRLTLVKDERP